MGHLLQIIDLFAGSCSVRKATIDRPVAVWATDIKSFVGIDFRCDLEYLQVEDLPFRPDLIWASLPCTSYSIAGIKWHRDGIAPRSAFAHKSDRLLVHLLDLIREIGCDYVIENPRGMLRKMPQVRDLPRRTVTYCSYGDRRMKPTDLWSNMFDPMSGQPVWEPRAMCRPSNPACDHDRQSRHYAVRKALGQIGRGTQGMSGAYARSVVPPALICEAVDAARRRLDFRDPSRACAPAYCACPTVPDFIVTNP